MLTEKRLNSFLALGIRLEQLTIAELEQLTQTAHNKNSWFTFDSVQRAINGIAYFLKDENLKPWLERYDHTATATKKIGVVAAGNIPLVGFHDLMCVLLSGHHLLLKPSQSDEILMRYVISELIKIDNDITDSIEIVERLNAADAYIATGSDNTARYFRYYFKDKPSIIRSNRTSVGILNGSESDDEIHALGKDIFDYFGLGCRNVSKLFVPEDFDFTRFLDGLAEYKYVADHHKYNNNYDYNKSIYLVNGEQHLDNGFLLLKESKDLVSPISVLYYQTYKDNESLTTMLDEIDSRTQCRVGHDHIPFGQAQYPSIDDYADGVDTMDFLRNL